MAIFQAIQHCFDGTGGGVAVVDPYLVDNLASCAWVSLEYNRNNHIPWETGEHDYIILRTFRGLISTLVGAIREGRCTWRADGSCIVNDFSIPAWFVEWAKKGWHWTPASVSNVQSVKKI